jgi:magnesium and cobalt exporter, CNNM family
MSITLNLTIAFLLILLNAFFVLAEFSLVRIRSTQIDDLSKKKKSKRALVAKKAVAEIDAYLSSIQLGITMTSLGLGWVGEPAMAKLIAILLPNLSSGISSTLSHSISFGVAFLFITSFHVILGEQVPKLIAIKSPARTLMLTSIPITIFYYITYFPMKALNKSARFVLKVIGFNPDARELSYSNDEMLMILSQSHEQGSISLGRFLMFENLFDFGNATVKEAMVPKDKISFLSMENSYQKNLDIIKSDKYSRFPLCKTGLDDTIGYILVKDMYFECGNYKETCDLEKHVRRMVYVNEDTLLEKALRELQEKRKHLALVKNSSGVVTGLITLEDIIEEVIGEIRDEIDYVSSTRLSNVLVTPASTMNLGETDKFKAMEKLLDNLHKEHPDFDRQTAWDLVLRRENMLTCALGKGVAFPHARLSDIAEPMVALGKAPKGLDFNTPDNEPVKMMFLILTPSKEPLAQIKILSQLATLASNDILRRKMLNAKTAKEILEIIRTFENRVAE